MKRRKFIETGLSFTSLLLFHKQVEACQKLCAVKSNTTGSARFSTIQLYTDKVNELYKFYHEIMKMSVVKKDNTSFTLKFGDSTLTFKQHSDNSSPRYHYAINVPTNKFAQAKQWLQERTKLLVDPENGKDEIFFERWNAHAVYFKDAAGNIGELIARHTLANKKEGPFGLNDLLCISEIGIPAEKPTDISGKLSSAFGLQRYLNSDMFIGDEYGLFVIPPTGRLWIPERIEKATVYPVDIVSNDKQLVEFDMPAYPYKIVGKS